MESLFRNVVSDFDAKEAKHAFARSTFSCFLAVSSLGGMLLRVTAAGSGTLAFARAISSSALTAKSSPEKVSVQQSLVPTQYTTLS